MTTKDKVARRKLSVPELASELDNVSRACRKLGIPFRDDLGDRFKVSDTDPIPNLAEIIPQRQSTTA